jgi:hypothetical protein
MFRTSLIVGTTGFPPLGDFSIIPVVVVGTRLPTSLSITISNFAADDKMLIMWVDSGGNLHSQTVTGPGVKTITGLTAGESYDFTALSYTTEWTLLSPVFFQSVISVTTPAPPVFDDLVNDGTGTSITASMTPPAGCEGVYVFYRALSGSDLLWHVETYAGDLPGDHQITGLSDGVAYEVLLMAYIGDLESDPTLPLSVLCSSSLTASNGDYINVEERVAYILNMDSGPGGLVNPTSPLVKLITRRARQRVSFYGEYEIPAIGVFCDSKAEPPTPTMESFLKTFKVEFLIMARGSDLLAVEDQVKAIMFRVEHVARLQTSKTNQWGGLPDLIEYSDAVLITRIISSAGPITPGADDPDKVQGEYSSYGIVTIEITVPCGIDL